MWRRLLLLLKLTKPAPDMSTAWATDESAGQSISTLPVGFCWTCDQAVCICNVSDAPIDWSALTSDEDSLGLSWTENLMYNMEALKNIIQQLLVSVTMMFLSLVGMTIIVFVQFLRREPITRLHMAIYYLIVFGFLRDHYLAGTLSQIYFEKRAKVVARFDAFARSDFGHSMLRPYRPIQDLFHQIKVIRARRAVRHEPYVGPNYLYVTRLQHVADVVTNLANLPTDQPWIGFDLEANNLGAYSHLSLMQVKDYLDGVVYLVDLLVLQEGAWNTPGADGTTTLRTIFEDNNRKKLIFDCRQDSACLYAKAGIRLGGVMDCQWMHMLTMQTAPEFRPGLISTISQMGGLDKEALQQWKDIKNSERSHGTWERRPIPSHAKAYAAGDVELLKAVHQQATTMLTRRAMRLVHIYSQFEVTRTQVEARKYSSIGRYTYDFVPEFWKRRLLRPGVKPNPVPAPQVSPF